MPAAGVDFATASDLASKSDFLADLGSAVVGAVCRTSARGAVGGTCLGSWVIAQLPAATAPITSHLSFGSTNPAMQ